MLKVAASTDKGHMVILGLSFENLDRLRKGQPIRIDLNELGIQGSTCLVFAGKDEKAMAETISEFIGPDTKVSELPSRWPYGRESG